MAAVYYFAKSALYPGHVFGQEYVLDLPFVTVLNPSEELTYTDAISIAGNRQTVVSRLEYLYSLETEHIEEQSDVYLHLNEFFHSVNRRERFKFDATGDAGVPGLIQPCQLTAEVVRSRAEPAAPIWVFKFKLRVLNA